MSASAVLVSVHSRSKYLICVGRQISHRNRAVAFINEEDNVLIVLLL